MIDDEIHRYIQSSIDKKLAPLLKRVADLEGRLSPPELRVMADPKPTPKPAPEWSNKVPTEKGHWRFYETSDKLMLNRRNETRMRANLTNEEIKEATEDIPGFAPEIDSGIESGNETNSP